MAVDRSALAGLLQVHDSAAGSGRWRRCTNHFWYHTALSATFATAARVAAMSGWPSVAKPFCVRECTYGLPGLSGAEIVFSTR